MDDRARGDSREIQRFRSLLEAERNAAVAADLDALLALQKDKRELVDELRGHGFDATVLPELAAKARANLQLMRHLVGVLRALTLPETDAYTPRGAREDTPAGARGRSRGAA
ncbi:MAG: hypothetical protein MJD61_12390 [Proteobacteria bacterium]|nr:hypothetical protein [Pseudomonadota bacterium]